MTRIVTLRNTIKVYPLATLQVAALRGATFQVDAEISSRSQAHDARVIDEVEKENSTVLRFKSAAVRPLAANMFTKARLESKSR